MLHNNIYRSCVGGISLNKETTDTVYDSSELVTLLTAVSLRDLSQAFDYTNLTFCLVNTINEDAIEENPSMNHQ